MKMLGHTRDSRPPSLLDPKEVSSEMLIGGVLFAIGAHLLLPLLVMLVTSVLAATVATTEPQTYVDEHIVEARFVQKGVKRDPKKLPDRIVPRKSTAPDRATVVSKDMNPEPPDKPKEKPPEDPVEDLLTRVGDRAQAFAEIAEEREKEGDPDGIEEGTETEAQAGDLYAGQLYAFFKRGWTIPNTIADPTKLVTVAEVTITSDLKLGDFAVVQSSGVPLFDQSVEDRLQQLQTEGQTVPEPPPEVAHRFIGRTIALHFKGK
jgi:outer membrane biosynthesis protein TonB